MYYTDAKQKENMYTQASQTDSLNELINSEPERDTEIAAVLTRGQIKRMNNQASHTHPEVLNISEVGVSREELIEAQHKDPLIPMLLKNRKNGKNSHDCINGVAVR
ncbi:hypothetical protein BgiBS90_036927 [Biomphalaria glabrata]|nr:hypothetical protein BgiBS90_036927 [Biomphalaria glabrata]